MSISLPNTTADPSFSYNGLDTRVGMSVSGSVTSWKRAGAYVTEPVLSGAGVDYVPGVSSRSGGVSTFTHAGMKNTTAQSVGASLNATKQFDAFGNVTSSTGTWQTPFDYAGNFGYQNSADGSGLMLLGHRYYDPTIGRFLTRDPIKDGRNWYEYCDNEPTGSVDPTGLKPGSRFKLVRSIFDEIIQSGAWEKTQNTNSEIGGWIYGGKNGLTYDLVTSTTPSGALILPPPNPLLGDPLGNWHTHPRPEGTYRDVYSNREMYVGPPNEPSDADLTSWSGYRKAWILTVGNVAWEFSNLLPPGGIGPPEAGRTQRRELNSSGKVEYFNWSRRRL